MYLCSFFFRFILASNWIPFGSRMKENLQFQSQFDKLDEKPEIHYSVCECFFFSFILHWMKFCTVNNSFTLVVDVIPNWHICRDISTRIARYPCWNSILEIPAILGKGFNPRGWQRTAFKESFPLGNFFDCAHRGIFSESCQSKTKFGL